MTDVSKHDLFAYLSVLCSGEGGEGIRRRHMCAGVGAIPSDVLQKNYLMLYCGVFGSYSYYCTSMGTY